MDPSSKTRTPLLTKGANVRTNEFVNSIYKKKLLPSFGRSVGWINGRLVGWSVCHKFKFLFKCSCQSSCYLSSNFALQKRNLYVVVVPVAAG